MQKRDAKAIGSRLMAFIKKNIHYILMILCVIAIGVVVTVVAVLNSSKPNVDVIMPDDKPNIEVPDNTDKPTIEKKFVLTMPVVGGVESRKFSDTSLSYNETMNRYDAHFAVDIQGNVGDNVLAGFEGTVLSVETHPQMGGIVKIDYGKGYVATFKLLADVAVKKGDKVTEKTVIGKIGKFGFEGKDKPHLHMELTENDKNVDPMFYMVGEDK